jgi:hypothetical protein
MQSLFLIINVLRIDSASLITRISACYLHGSVVHPPEEVLWTLWPKIVVRGDRLLGAISSSYTFVRTCKVR